MPRVREGKDVKTQSGDEVLEILEQLQIPIEGDDDLQLVCELLAGAMTEAERLTAERTKATAELRKKLDELQAPYREPLENQQAIVEAAKRAVVARVLADERAQDTAIAARQPVPEPRKLPAGLTIKRVAFVEQVDVKALDDRFLTAVADIDGILAAHAAGEAVEGATIDTKTTASLNRKNAATK